MSSGSIVPKDSFPKSSCKPTKGGCKTGESDGDPRAVRFNMWQSAVSMLEQSACREGRAGQTLFGLHNRWRGRPRCAGGVPAC